jgi:hypothetical protein
VAVNQLASSSLAARICDAVCYVAVFASEVGVVATHFVPHHRAACAVVNILALPHDIEDRPVPAFASRRRANSAVQYLGAGQSRVDTFTVKSVDGTAKTSRSRSTAPMMRLWHQPTLLQWPTPLSKALGTHIVHTPPSN